MIIVLHGQSCTDSSECTEPTPYCHPDNVCRECINSSHCAGRFLKICDWDGFCDLCNRKTGEGCPTQDCSSSSVHVIQQQIVPLFKTMSHVILTA